MKLFKKTIYVTSITFIILFYSTTRVNSLDIEGGTTKDLIPIQRPLAILSPRNELAYKPKLRPGEARLNVRTWVNRKNATYRIGDSVTFFVKVNKNAYITLLDIGTTGKTHIIFPNKYSKTNFVRAGTTLSIPRRNDGFRIKVEGIRGREVVKVIATTKPVTIIPKKYLSRTGYFKEISTKDLRVVATHINNTLNNKRHPREWDEFTKIINIQ